MHNVFDQSIQPLRRLRWIEYSITSGKIVHIVVLNSEDLFVGWQGRGTAACHVFDVMKLASVSQFIGRAVRQYRRYPRDDTHHHSLKQLGPVTTCVVVYLSVAGMSSQQLDSDDPHDDADKSQQHGITAANKIVLIRALRRKKREVQSSAAFPLRRALLSDIDKCLMDLKSDRFSICSLHLVLYTSTILHAHEDFCNHCSSRSLAGLFLSPSLESEQLHAS